MKYEEGLCDWCNFPAHGWRNQNGFLCKFCKGVLNARVQVWGWGRDKALNHYLHHCKECMEDMVETDDGQRVCLFCETLD